MTFRTAMNHIKEFLVSFIERRFKVWGVELETNLAPEFFITKHAEQRLRERLNVNPDKFAKVTVKAWHSKVVSNPKMNRLDYAKEFDARKYYCYYRELMGWIFVFGVRIGARGALQHQKVLITVYK